MIHRIDSRSNQKVKDLVKQRDNYWIFEGEKLVRDILGRGIAVARLIVHKQKEGHLDLAGKNIAETWVVTETVLEKISALKERPDVIAVLEPKESRIDFAGAKTVIALDAIQDPGNAGTIFRCAAAFGIDGVALCSSCVKPTNPKFLRAAQTAFFDVDFQVFADTETLVKRAKENKSNIYLTSADPSCAAANIGEVQFPCVILFGSEGRGLNEELFDRFPTLRIPQHENVESLNVGVAACIIMHELRKPL